MLFLDRQTVLKVLFENIQDKSKLLTGKCVVNIKLEDDGVTVTTKDGSVYNGDICIGADGIHSNVRSEMWRNADALCPGYIPDTEPTCEFTCYSPSDDCKKSNIDKSHAV